jgi:quinol monooxygenase YgiN
MIVVAGQIHVKRGKASAFVASSSDAMIAARKAKGFHDFIVAADPIEDNRINGYERWASVRDVMASRGGGPGDDLSALIVRAEVQRHSIRKSCPA